MCRNQRQLDGVESDRIAAAAIACFAERGFGGATVRDLAAAAGVPVARLYDHHRSKRALIAEVVTAAADRRLGQAVAALADAPPDPLARLEAVVEALADFHTTAPQEAALLADAQLAHLEPEARVRVQDRRDELEHLLLDVITAGIERGVFRIASPQAAARFLLGLAAGPSASHGTAGPRTTRRTARAWCRLARHITGATPSAQPAAPALGPSFAATA